MNSQRVLLCCLAILTAITLCPQPAAAQTFGVERQLSDRLVVKVDPQAELLLAVLYQTDWLLDVQQPHKPSADAYITSLSTFLDNYRDHAAVRLAQDFVAHGFRGSTAIDFMTCLGPLPDLPMVCSVPESVLQAAGGAQRLEEFRLALVDLAREANFDAFYNLHRGFFERYVDDYVTQAEPCKVLQWLIDFFGEQKADQYEVILLPGKQGGSYETAVVEDSGQQVVRVFMNATAEGEVDYERYQEDRHSLLLHELGHGFAGQIRPTDTRLRLLALREGWAMSQQGYGILALPFYTEQVDRAVVVLGLRALDGVETAGRDLRQAEERGFYLTGYTVDHLEYYESHRQQYPTFDQYLPELMNDYRADAWRLLGIGPVLAVLALAALSWLFVRRTRGLAR